MSKETMQTAISQAIESLNPASQTPPAADPPADPSVAEDPPADAPPADDTPAGDPPAGEDPAGETEGDTPAGDEPPADPAAAAAKPPGTKPDHVNDPIPKELKEQTQERIRFLAGEVKTLQPLAETGRMLLDAIDDAQMSPQELQFAIGYSKLIHSANIEDNRKGFAVLMNEVKALAERIGEPLPGTDPVAAHADLVQEVKDGKLTPQRALEIATTRGRAAATTKAQQTNDTRAQDEAAFERDRLAAVADLNTLGKELAESDPHFQAKYDAIVPALKVAFQNVHPSRWKTVFLNTYKNWKVSLPAPAAPAPSPAPAPPSPQPLRANKQPSGGSVQTPSTMAEAINAGIAQASRR